MTEEWGNPSSTYRFGIKAKDIVKKSRKKVADLIGADPSEIIFTSGACESNSHAICGYLGYHNTEFVTSAIEHKSIMNIAKTYKNRTVIIPVDKHGFVDTYELKETLENAPSNTLVSIQYANNEIGTIQNIEYISKIVHDHDGVLHTDATQIIPDKKISVSGIDMMSFSGQKLGAPKGIGVLYIRNGIKINPIIYGSQEKSRRGGTENVPYIAGLRAAIENLKYFTHENRNYFVDRILNEIEDCYLIGCEIGKQRLKNNASICFKGVDSASLSVLLDLNEIYVSSGSACNSSSMSPSHVLKDVGISKDDINSVIRFTFGENTRAEIDTAIEVIKKNVNSLRMLRNKR